jgi:predicted transcriptional regulator
MDGNTKLVELASQIVASYVANHQVPQADLPRLIDEVFRSLAKTMGGEAPKEELHDTRPAVSVKKSITPDYLVCLEDGKKFKSLKRHLRTHYNLTPEQYREKWNLPADYPMVAPNYAVARSSLAKSMGLGRRNGR